MYPQEPEAKPANKGCLRQGNKQGTWGKKEPLILRIRFSVSSFTRLTASVRIGRAFLTPKGRVWFSSQPSVPYRRKPARLAEAPKREPKQHLDSETWGGVRGPGGGGEGSGTQVSYVSSQNVSLGNRETRTVSGDVPNSKSPEFY